MKHLTNQYLTASIDADERRRLLRSLPTLINPSPSPLCVTGVRVIMSGAIDENIVSLIATPSGVRCVAGRIVDEPAFTPPTDTPLAATDGYQPPPQWPIRAPDPEFAICDFGIAVAHHLVSHTADPSHLDSADLVHSMLDHARIQRTTTEFARDMALAARLCYASPSGVVNLAMVEAIDALEAAAATIDEACAAANLDVASLNNWFDELALLNCTNLTVVGPYGFRAGAVAVVGGTNVGKSPVSLAIARMTETDTCSAGFSPISEPFPGYTGYDTFVSEVITYVNEYIDGSVSAAHLVDSLKDVFIMLKGAAWKAGFARTTVPMLTTLSRLYATIGALVVLPLNTAGLSDDDVQGLIGQSVSCLLTCTTPWDGVSAVWSALQRVAPSRPRVSFDIVVADGSDGTASIAKGRTTHTGQYQIEGAAVPAQPSHISETAMAPYANGINI